MACSNKNTVARFLAGLFDPASTNRMNVFSIRSLMNLLSVLPLCLLYPSCANAEETTEYRLKAAFLYNFAAYTEWPIPPTHDLKMCIYGKDPFGKNLNYINNKKINEHTLVVYHVDNINDLTDCHIVFITQSTINHLTELINRLDKQPILTVADTPGVGRQGVILNMTVQNEKIIFEANSAVAKRKGLKLSSQLLRFASEVYQ